MHRLQSTDCIPQTTSTVYQIYQLYCISEYRHFTAVDIQNMYTTDYTIAQTTPDYFAYAVVHNTIIHGLCYCTMLSYTPYTLYHNKFQALCLVSLHYNPFSQYPLYPIRLFTCKIKLAQAVNQYITVHIYIFIVFTPNIYHRIISNKSMLLIWLVSNHVLICLDGPSVLHVRKML